MKIYSFDAYLRVNWAMKWSELICCFSAERGFIIVSSVDYIFRIMHHYMRDTRNNHCDLLRRQPIRIVHFSWSEDKDIYSWLYCKIEHNIWDMIWGALCKSGLCHISAKKVMWLQSSWKQQKCRITLFFIFFNESWHILLRKRREKQNWKIILGFEKWDRVFKVQKTPKTHRPLLHNAPTREYFFKSGAGH